MPDVDSIELLCKHPVHRQDHGAGTLEVWMRIAVVSDIHGNRTALEAVLVELSQM